MLVDQCWGRERAGQEVQCWGRSVGMKSLESLQGQPSVHREDFHLSWGDQKRGQATEQFGGRIAGLYSQACCWIPSVTPGHPAGNDSIEGLGVASNPSSDAGKVGAGSRAQDTHMLSLCGEGEGCSIHSDGEYIMPVLSRVVTLWLE